MWDGIRLGRETNHFSARARTQCSTSAASRGILLCMGLFSRFFREGPAPRPGYRETFKKFLIGNDYSPEDLIRVVESMKLAK
jgi:hypothetical protein